MPIMCPHCHLPYEIEENLFGQNLECGVCGKSLPYLAALVLSIVAMAQRRIG